MTIAVTGATGQLGSLVVDELLKTEDPASIVAVVRNEEKAAGLSAKGVDVRVASYTDPVALEAAFSGVDTVLLVSGNEIGQRVAQHKNVIDAAKTAGVSRLVYTSAPKATTSELVLAPEHKATEEYLVESGIGHSIVRNGWYTENYVPQVEGAKESGVIVAAAGEGRVSSASRVDYAAGAAAVLVGDGHEGKTYEFSGDYAWNYTELATSIGEVVGRDVAYESVDPETLVKILTTQAGLDEQTAGFLAVLDTNTAQGLLGEVTGELSALIGRPTTPLLEGLKAAV